MNFPNQAPLILNAEHRILSQKIKALLSYKNKYEYFFDKHVLMLNGFAVKDEEDFDLRLEDIEKFFQEFEFIASWCEDNSTEKWSDEVVLEIEKSYDTLVRGFAEYHNDRDASYSLLFIAIVEGDVLLLKSLIKAGVNLNKCIAQKNALTVAMKDVVKNIHTDEIIEILLTNGANVNVKDENNNSLLAKTVGRDDEGAYSLKFIALGADVKASNNFGDTPLIFSSRFLNYKTTDYLLDHGAQVTHQNDHGATPLMLAIRNDLHPGKSYILANEGRDRLKVVLALLDNAAGINTVNKAVNLADKDGNTALFYALECYENSRGIRELLKRNAKVEHQNNLGQTPLMIAAEKGYLASMCLMIDHALEHDIDILNFKDHQGKKVYDYNYSNGNTPISQAVADVLTLAIRAFRKKSKMALTN